MVKNIHPKIALTQRPINGVGGGKLGVGLSNGRITVLAKYSIYRNFRGKNSGGELKEKD